MADTVFFKMSRICSSNTWCEIDLDCLTWWILGVLSMFVSKLDMISLPLRQHCWLETALDFQWRVSRFIVELSSSFIWLDIHLLVQSSCQKYYSKYSVLMCIEWFSQMWSIAETPQSMWGLHSIRSLSWDHIYHHGVLLHEVTTGQRDAW